MNDFWQGGTPLVPWTAEQQTRRWTMEQEVYNRGEYLRLARAAAARSYGMNPEEYNRPYPGSSTVINHYQISEPTAPAPAPTPAPQPQPTPAPAPVSPPTPAAPASPVTSGRRAGWVGRALTGLALLAGGLCGGLGLAALLNRPAAVAPAAKPDAYDWEADFWIKDGKPELGPPRPVKPKEKP